MKQPKKQQSTLIIITALVNLFISFAVHADTAKARCDIYPKGSDKASTSVACTFSQRQGYININRTDAVEYDLSPTAEDPGKYTDQDGKPAYRNSDLGKLGLIFRMADESVYVYWDPYPFWQEKEASGFEHMYELDGISFSISSPNNASTNILTIQPGGLKPANDPITVEIDGSVTAAEIADLDNNGSPEIYVFINSAGSGSYGSVVAYAVNDGKSITPVYMAPLTDDPVNSIGYMGHDEFSIVEFMLLRRFPIYQPGDNNASPSGGTRQLQYKLVAGEAGWILKQDLVLEF